MPCMSLSGKEYLTPRISRLKEPSTVLLSLSPMVRESVGPFVSSALVTTLVKDYMCTHINKDIEQSLVTMQKVRSMHVCLYNNTTRTIHVTSTKNISHKAADICKSVL